MAWQELLSSWALEDHGCRIMPSVTDALSEAERQILQEMSHPVTPVRRTAMCLDLHLPS